MSGGQSTDFQSRFFENNSMEKDEAHPVECKLVSFDALKLDKMAKNDKGYYISLVILPANMLMIVDNKACNLRLYRRDGKLLAKSDKLQSQPWDVCLINATEVAVILFDGQIEIMSFDTTTISRQKTLYTSGFDKCHAVKILGSLGTCVVSGRKQDNISWGIVSLDNGHVNTVHKICEGKFGVSYLATSPYNTCTMVYVSCDAGPFSRDTGLYGFDINTGTKEFLYQHKELENPRGVSMDTRDSVYVCNWGRPSCIHQLNELRDPVTIHREGMPLRLLAMYFEKQQEELFVTSFESNEVRIYKPEYKDHQGLPPEIRKMDMKSQQLFQDALKAGKQKVYNIRLMVVGHYGVGKTTLTKRILGEKITEEFTHVPTQGIEVHSECCRIDHDTKKWNVNEIGHFSNTDQLLVDIVHEHVEKSSGGVKSDMSVVNSDVSDVKLDVLAHNLETQTDIKIANDSDEHRSGLIEVQNTSPSTHVIEKSLTQSDFDRFVMRNKSLTYSGKPVSYVTILDFAGQFLFYTTHQAFMSWRTLYLLVTDITMSMDDIVRGDMCHMDLNGCKECSIQEYAIYWLNSIYSHVQQQAGSIGQSQEKEPNHPPVILVATHMDKLPEKMRKRRKEDYFSHVTRILMGRPLIHLVKGMFAISNFGQDADIDELKQKMFELAQKQGYWGEEIPVAWLALQQKLMELKSAGEPIVQYEYMEKLNNSSDGKIESPAELEVFLRFQHDLGNIVLYSTEKLRGMVVLDPNWLIDGVKIMMSPSEHLKLHQPDLLPQWYDFKESGRLTDSLIDWLWSEDQHEKYRHNKKHLLKVMETLSIIAKPIEKEDDVQMLEKYYWVPCMIHKIAPVHVKNGEYHKYCTKTSTLCFVSKMKFIHVGVFHRLVASCLSKWPAAKEGKEYLLYSGCCEFKIDNCHTLLLSLMDFVILATIFRYSRKGVNPDKNLCISVKKFIRFTLSEIAACICPNAGFDINVKCERSSIHTTEGLLEMSGNEEVRCECIKPAHCVNVDELVKFWEQKMDSAEEICLHKSDMTMPEECHKSLHQRDLAPGKIYHAFFCYASPDQQWVKKIVKKLEKDHGFVCCEYDRDNIPGKPLLKFADDSIRNACKTVVVMTREAFQSGFVEHEIQMAINQGFIEKRNCIVPVLVEDCEIPGYLRVLNYVDARDTNRSSIWWPKLLMELGSQGDQKAPEGLMGEERKQPVIEESPTWIIKQGIETKGKAGGSTVETPEQAESMRSVQIGKQEFPVSSEDLEQFEQLQKTLEAGTDDITVGILDTIREKGSEILKTQVLKYLSKHLENKMTLIEKQAKVKIWPGTNSTGGITFVCFHQGKLKTKLTNYFNIDIFYNDIDKVAPKEGLTTFFSTRWAIHGSQYKWWRKNLGKPQKEPPTHEKLLTSFLTYPHWPNPRLEPLQTAETETVKSLGTENQDVRTTGKGFAQWEEALAAGPDDENAVKIVDTIRKQGDEETKSWMLWHLVGLLTNIIASTEKQPKFRIWPSTNISAGEITFVCLYKGKLETKFKSFFHIDIFYKSIDTPAPLIDLRNPQDLNWIMPTEKDALLIQSAIEEHGDRLFSQHSNLQVVCGGPFLLHERQGFIQESKVIILYCHTKGYVPHGEEKFPSLLHVRGIDIPVDISEGYFALATGDKEWHPTLSMGISIGEKGQKWSGTLGPFVDLGNEELGFITCAHVVGTEGTDVVQPSEGDIRGQKTLEETVCGSVLKRVFNPGFSDGMNGFIKIVGVDAALVKLNKNRPVDHQTFPPVPESELLPMGLTAETKLLYTGDRIGCSQESRKIRGKPVIKSGRTSGLRMGLMALEGAMVKISEWTVEYENWKQKHVMKGLYLIESTGQDQFAERGDSGAGIFLLHKDNKLTLIGLVIGVLHAAYDRRCVATPIEYVLRALDVSPDQLRFCEKMDIDI